MTLPSKATPSLEDSRVGLRDYADGVKSQSQAFHSSIATAKVTSDTIERFQRTLLSMSSRLVPLQAVLATEEFGAYFAEQYPSRKQSVQSYVAAVENQIVVVNSYISATLEKNASEKLGSLFPVGSLPLLQTMVADLIALMD